MVFDCLLDVNSDLCGDIIQGVGFSILYSKQCNALQSGQLSNYNTKNTGHSVPEMLICLLLLFFSGESGLGKSTLINSLFLTDLYSAEYPGPSHRIKKTVQVHFDK